MKIARAKRQELLFFIVKYANLWRSSRRRGCLKLPSVSSKYESNGNDDARKQWSHWLNEEK